MTLAEFDALFESLSNWNRWGADDEKGTLNYLTGAHADAAAGSVAKGRPVSMCLTIRTKAAPDNDRPALHYMTQLAEFQTGEPTSNLDFFGFDYHGKSITHIDALCHCAYRGRLYNGYLNREVVSAAGASRASVMTLRDGITGRGVLLDMPRLKGVDWLEPGTAITVADLEAAEKAEGVRVGEGDILIVRTGSHRRREELGPWDVHQASAGLHPTCMPWLHERRIAVMCADGEHDVRPDPMPHMTSPIHTIALVAMGLHLLDNLYLEDVARACAEEGRWHFLFTAAPLLMPGATGSPCNPLAIF
jgi:kynurenine formamidase